MSDHRLRDLERRWQESGAAADEAAFLKGCLRSGELDVASLELAAYLDHPAAQFALGRIADEHDDLQRWVAELQPLGGVTALRRAALAAAQCALAHWGDAELRKEVGVTWEEARAFVLCPCRPHVPPPPMLGLPPYPKRFRLWVALVQIGWPPTCVEIVDEALWRLEQAELDDPEATLRAWIRDALVPWALGRYDPLRDGWVELNSRYSREQLLAEAPEAAALLAAGGAPGHAVARRLRVSVLDPGLAEALKATDDPVAAIDRALRFEPAIEDTRELLGFLEFYTHRKRTVAGTTHDFEWFFETGWRELPLERDP